MKSKTKQSKVYHNTLLLLRSYKDLKEHIKGGESLIAIEVKAFEDWSEMERVTTTFEDYLKSAKKTKTITAAMMQLVDKYLKLYKSEARKRGDTAKLYRWEVIDRCYISGNDSFAKISIDMNCDPKTVSRWHNRAVEELSVYFFGIEGVKLDKIQQERKE